MVRKTCPTIMLAHFRNPHFRRGAVLAALFSSIGCKEDPPPQPQVQTSSPQEEGPTAAELEARAKAEAEAKRRAEREAREQAMKRRDACCLALAKKGFELRSEEYIAGKDICEEAKEEENLLGAVIADIEEAIEDEELPKDCDVSDEERKEAEASAAENAEQKDAAEAAETEGDGPDE